MWERVAVALRDDDTEWLLVDGSYVRAHPATAGVERKRAGAAVKRPRRWAAAVSPLGHPVAMRLIGANAADSPHLPALIAGVETRAVLADKGYDAGTNRQTVRGQGAEPCIPPRKNRTAAVAYVRHLDKERNAAE